MTNQPSDGLTGVGARDDCASKNKDYVEDCAVDCMLDVIVMLTEVPMVVSILRLQDKFEVHRNSKYPETGRFPRIHLLSFHFSSKKTIIPSTGRETSQRISI